MITSLPGARRRGDIGDERCQPVAPTSRPAASTSSAEPILTTRRAAGGRRETPALIGAQSLPAARPCRLRRRLRLAARADSIARSARRARHRTPSPVTPEMQHDLCRRPFPARASCAADAALASIASILFSATISGLSARPCAIGFQLVAHGALGARPTSSLGAVDQVEQHAAALDMAEEAVADARAFMRALDQAGNIGQHEFALADGDHARVAGAAW